jgi:hypothetical protein
MRVNGSFAHSSAADLLREVTRLAPRVELAGDLAPFASFTDGEIISLRRVARADAAIRSPEQLAPARRTLARLASLAGVETGAYAVIHDHTQLAAFAGCAFRLSSSGGSLDALADAATDAATRDALAPVVPPCLLPRDPSITPSPQQPAAYAEPPRDSVSEVDRFGRFDPCTLASKCSAASRCPGIAVGWTSRRIEAQP